MKTNTWLHVNFAGATPQLPSFFFFVFWSIIKLNLSLSPLFFSFFASAPTERRKRSRTSVHIVSVLLEAFAKRLFRRGMSAYCPSDPLDLKNPFLKWHSAEYVTTRRSLSSLHKYVSEMPFQIYPPALSLDEVEGEAWQRMPDITRVRQVFPLHLFPHFFSYRSFFIHSRLLQTKNIILSALKLRHADHASRMTHSQWKSTDPPTPLSSSHAYSPLHRSYRSLFMPKRTPAVTSPAPTAHPKTHLLTP